MTVLIRIPDNYPAKTVKMYGRLTERIFRYYERQLPDACEDLLAVHIQEEGTTSDSGSSIESATAERVTIELERDHPELILQASFEIMSHGIAHSILMRAAGYKFGANGIHLAFNEYEAGQKSPYWRYRYMFESWKRPVFRLLILDLKALIADRDKIELAIATDTAKAGRHRYYK